MRSGIWKRTWSLALLVSLGLASQWPSGAWADDVEAGPIWNQADAQRKCPQVCQPRQWNGQWRTTRPNQMSICQCVGGFIPTPPPPPPLPPPSPPGGGAGFAWHELPGRALDVGMGANGAPWVIGTKRVPGGNAIYNWNGTTWLEVPGGAVRIAVAPDGAPWVVNSEGGIFQLVGNGWRQLPGRATDIGVGGNGAVWAIGRRPVPGGYSIMKWKDSLWAEVPGGAVRIAVAPDGMPWVVNSAGNIFQYNGRGWRQLPGLAKDIGIGADGQVWVIGTNPVPGGFGIYQWTGTDFSPVQGGATNISVGPTGMPMVANADGKIFMLEPAAPPPPPPPPPHGGRGALVAANGKCFDIHDPDFQSRANGGRVQIWDCHGGPNQQWRMAAGTVMAGNGKCLDVHDGDFRSRANGGRVQLWDCNGGPNQQWSWNGAALVSANGKCLDIHDGDFQSQANGGRAQTWDCHGGPNQQWSLQRHRGGAPVPPPPPPPPPVYAPPPPPPPPVVYAPPPRSPGVVPFSQERFSRLLQQVSALAFTDEKIRRLQDYLSPETFFTTRQVAQLMQTTAFGGDRIRIAALLWPRVVDQESFPDLIELFTFESDRQELRRQLRR